MLRECEPGFTKGAAVADVKGHLTDLLELLASYAR